MTAPAKLTLSLRITGVRADGYHLLEAEMVTLDLADTLVIEDGDGLQRRPPEPVAGFTGWQGRHRISTGPDNLVARALVATGRTAKVHVVKRIPPGAGLGGGSADAAAILRWAGCSDLVGGRRAGRRRPLLPGRGQGHGPGNRRGGRAAAVRGTALHPACCCPSAWTPDPSTGPGTTWPGGAPRRGTVAAGNDLEAAAVVVEPRLDRWRLLFEEITGRRPHLAGSGSTWFVEGRAEELGLADGRVLQLEGEQAVAGAGEDVSGRWPG